MPINPTFTRLIQLLKGKKKNQKKHQSRSYRKPKWVIHDFASISAIATKVDFDYSTLAYKWIMLLKISKSKNSILSANIVQQLCTCIGDIVRF